MAKIGPLEFIIILAIVIFVFGVGRLSYFGGEMGSAIREFRKGLQGEGENQRGNEANGNSGADGQE